MQNYFKIYWKHIIGISCFQCTLRTLGRVNVLTKALRKGQSFPVCLLETDLYCLPFPVPVMGMNTWPISCQFVVLGCWKHICPIVFHWDFCAAGVSFLEKIKSLKERTIGTHEHFFMLEFHVCFPITRCIAFCCWSSYFVSSGWGTPAVETNTCFLLPVV